MCVVGGHIYAVGGRDYSNQLDSVERYDPQTNTWEFVAPLKNEVSLCIHSVQDYLEPQRSFHIIQNHQENHLEPFAIIQNY